MIGMYPSTNILGYLDFETYHEPIDDLCLLCNELAKKTTSITLKKKLANKCRVSNHIRVGKNMCDTCVIGYHEEIEKCRCTHEKLKYRDSGEEKYFATCGPCHSEIVSTVDCQHLGSIGLRRLTPASYNYT